MVMHGHDGPGVVIWRNGSQTRTTPSACSARCCEAVIGRPTSGAQVARRATYRYLSPVDEPYNGLWRCIVRGGLDRWVDSDGRVEAFHEPHLTDGL